jgi:hypothetical protein
MATRPAWIAVVWADDYGGKVMRIHRRLTPWAPLVAALLMAPGCDRFPGVDAIGVRLDPEARGIVVTKVLCPGDRVTAVYVTLDLDDKEATIWRIEPQRDSSQSTFVIGDAPLGFLETTPLRQDLESAEEVFVAIETVHDAGAVQDFTTSELRTDELLTPDGYRDPNAFLVEKMKRCSD